MGNPIFKIDKDNTVKSFLDRFNSLCYYRNGWEVWANFVTASACAIANSIDRDSESHDQREKEYAKCIERLGGVDTAAEMLSLVAIALEENPEQDFLGELFMRLNMGNHWKGQFFTPYSVCKVMAEINYAGLNETVEEKGWVSVNDCACGAGATLIAMANTMKNHNLNYQNHALFVAQDIDRVTGLMCYIQLSLLGCPGYIVIADSLSNPIVGSTLQPVIKENQEFWFTPMYASYVWKYRRFFNMMDAIFKS